MRRFLEQSCLICGVVIEEDLTAVPTQGSFYRVGLERADGWIIQMVAHESCLDGVAHPNAAYRLVEFSSVGHAVIDMVLGRLGHDPSALSTDEQLAVVRAAAEDGTMSDVWRKALQGQRAGVDHDGGEGG